MNSPAPWRILIVAEGPSDRRRLCSLMDHLIQRYAGEVDLDRIRRFEQFHGDSYLQIKRIPGLTRELKLDRRYSPAGHNKGDAGTLRKLYQVLQKEKMIAPDLIVVWGRDDDGVHHRRDEAMLAQVNLSRPPRLLLAIASECGEAWVIAGWRAASDDDSRSLESLRQELGFDPCIYPERLSHKEDAPKSPKRALKTLFADDEVRETGALIVAAGEEASTGCGLCAFCDDVDAWLSETTA